MGDISAVCSSNIEIINLLQNKQGFFVDNVDPELRDKGDVIVASNNNHGVAEVVRRFILN